MLSKTIPTNSGKFSMQNISTVIHFNYQCTFYNNILQENFNFKKNRQMLHIQRGNLLHYNKATTLSVNKGKKVKKCQYLNLTMGLTDLTLSGHL